jgi:hypothetical protein
VRDEKSYQRDRPRIIGSAQIRVNNRRGMVRSRMGTFAIGRRSRWIDNGTSPLTKHHPISKTDLSGVTVSAYRTASNAGDCHLSLRQVGCDLSPQMDFVSIPRFIEWNWGLGAFTDPAQFAREQQTGDLWHLLTTPCSSPWFSGPERKKAHVNPAIQLS